MTCDNAPEQAALHQASRRRYDDVRFTGAHYASRRESHDGDQRTLHGGMSADGDPAMREPASRTPSVFSDTCEPHYVTSVA
jgi:hypothetical protein